MPERLQGIQSVETGFAVLDVLVAGGGPMTLGEVARGAALSPSQARRYLVSLVRCGMVVQDDSTGRYDLGSSSLRVGLAALARVEAVDLATIALKELVAKTHEGGTLSVWGDGGATVVRWLRGGGIGVTSLSLGTIFPLMSSATGHVFLAYLPEDNVRAQLERELGARELSLPDVWRRIGALRDKVRAMGHGWLKGHFVENIRGAAAPIFDSQGELVAVLAIAGPDRSDASGKDPSVTAMIAAAAAVSRQLCFDPKPGAMASAHKRAK
ncbi:MAG: IclR family transcriptional regulator [Proteobacteria bacterium]|nr:IclR family transcriptional regulator [Pseudomonadota bacterium]